MNQSERRLAVGEEVVCEIPARPRWVSTFVRVEKDEQYTLAAQGEWHDASIGTGPQGYASPNAGFRAVERWRRAPEARWFELVGSIDQDVLFRIGAGTTLLVAKSGVIVCFANDLPFMYWNNKGAITLTLRRTH